MTEAQMRERTRLWNMHDHDSSQAGRAPAATATGPSTEVDEGGHHHSMWWMVVCCAPMVLLAVAILLGVFGPR